MPYHFSSAEYQPFASLVQSAVTTIAIILSSGAAIRGLNSWRRQLEANVNLEVKRALLPAVYRLRNALLGIRFPVIFGWEQAAARLSLSGVPTTSRDEEARAIWAALWKQVSDRIPDVESASVEAEAVWGKEAKRQIDELLTAVSNFYIDLNSYIRLSARSGDNQGDDQLRLELHDTIFGPSEKDKPDVFKDRVNKIVREIELFAEAKQSVAHNRLGMLGLDRRTRKLK